MWKGKFFNVFTILMKSSFTYNNCILCRPHNLFSVKIWTIYLQNCFHFKRFSRSLLEWDSDLDFSGLHFFFIETFLDVFASVLRIIDLKKDQLPLKLSDGITLLSSVLTSFRIYHWMVASSPVPEAATLL